ncbi:MAG: gliding motility-associated ABC transporter permease subunit GldF [Flavobacteriales bacterium]|nr:gliding motility-associated ABC transporter permease subunit GldF [Flavobacteriaceae bacterium]PHX92944.1 MAG: gliding motility-associated ABC transporter permease subunit GldF [Flavobacteriales bacterium]
MWAVFKKEIRSFLGSFIAYIVMGVFLLITGLFIWVIEGTNVMDIGLANMQVLFNIAPYILIFLVSAITMRSLSEEKRLGTIEILSTRPVSDFSILMGKYLAALGLIVFTLLPTLFYYYTISTLADPLQGTDIGATWSSYFGLILLAASYASIGLFASALSDNQIVSLVVSMVLCFFWYGILGLLGDIKALDTIGKSLGWFGLDFHYKSISRGVFDTRDLLYFLGFIASFIGASKLVFESRKW